MSSFIDRLKAKMAAGGGVMADRTAPPVKREKSRKVVRTNRFDDKVYHDGVRQTESVSEFIHDLYEGDDYKGGNRKEFEQAPELVEGLFHSLYKAAPKLEGKRSLARDLYPVRKILEEVQANPKLKELQEYTASDPMMSTMAMQAMEEPIREILARVQQQDPPPPPGPKPKPPEDDTITCGGYPSDPGDQPGEPGQPGEGQPDPNGQEQGEGPAGSGSGSPREQEAPEGDGSENEQDLTNDADTPDFDPDQEFDEEAEAEWEQQWDDILDGLDLDRLANKALEAAEREASELENLRKGIGLEDGEWATMSPAERVAMAERLRTPQMRELADIIGRMKRFALGVKATRVVDVPHEIYDVETGNDLRRILRPQLALLATKETSLEFYRRYVDKELLVYKMRGTEEVGKGPMVMCVDKSASMNGQPFHWALGVAEALRRFAAEEERDLYVMFFGNNNDRVRFEFPKGQAPFEKIMAFLGTVANGGTQFDGVLTEALQKASTAFDGSGESKADIVFITDGNAHLSEDWIRDFNKERERVGVRVYSIYIGGAYDMSYQSGPLGLLEQFSDATIPVSELKPEAVRAVFERV